MDFLKETQAVVNVHANSVSFYDEMVVLNLLSHFSAADNIARVARKYVLTPSSETFITVKVPRNYVQSRDVNNSALLIESLPVPQDAKIVISRSLAKVTDTIALIKVLNISKDKVKLRPSQAIAYVSTINDASLINLPESLNDNTPCTVKGDIRTPSPISSVNNFSAISRESVVKNQPAAATLLNASVRPSAIVDELKIKINDKLNIDERNQLIQLIENNDKVFSRGMHDLPGTDIYEHRIEVSTTRPIRSQPYKHTPADNAEIDRQVSELLKHDIIYPSTSLWASPCLLVKKQNGDKRLVFDYRKVNDVINKISFPVQLPSQIFDSIAEQKARIFSVLDMKSSYNQIKIAPESQDKTTFITHNGQYAFKRLPFGLSHSGSVFVAVITQLFRQNSFRNLNSYVDDLIVYSQDFSQHLEHLEYVFKTLASVNLKLNAEKCDLCLPEVNYLGLTVSEKGVAINPKKVAIVKNYPTPKNVKQVRQFLGFVNFYRKFIHKYSIIAHPLNALLRHEVAFRWSPQCQAAFEALKEALINPPILAHPDMSKPFIVTTDASTTAIGWTLSQLDDNNKERAILYGGRSLRDAELNWDVTSLEGISLVSAIKSCHHYLSDNYFVVYTDHESLVQLKNTQNKSGRLFRWAILLQEYRFDVKHKSGKANHVDALSRIPYIPETQEEQNLRLNDDEYDKIRVIAVDNNSNQTRNFSENVISSDEPDFVNIHEYVEVDISYQANETNSTLPTCYVNSDRIAAIIDLANVQRNAPELKRFYDYLENDVLPEDDAIARKTRFESESYFIRDNILYHLYAPRNLNLDVPRLAHEQIVIPSSMKNTILQSFHDDFAHAGFDRMYASIRTRYYWPTMYNDIRDYTSTCEICQKNKRQYHATRAPLCPLPVGDIFSRIHIDIIGILPESGEQKYRYILIVVDSFSKWIEAFPLRTQTSLEIAEVLFREYFTRYGFPQQINSDRGANLISRIMQHLCKFCKIKRIVTSAFHQSANSMAERNVGSIVAAIRCYISNQNEWFNALPSILMAFRATVCTQSTEFSPYEVLFGRIMRMATDIIFAPSTGFKDVDDYMAQLIPRLELIHQTARENSVVHQETYKKIYDRNSKEVNLPIGSKHWLFMPQPKKGINKKLRNLYAGPFYITDQVSETNYKIRDAKTHKTLAYTVHRSRLKPCNNFRDIYEIDELSSFDFDDDTELLEKPVEVEDGPVSDDEPDPVDQPMILRPKSPQPDRPTSAQSSHNELRQNDDDDVMKKKKTRISKQRRITSRTSRSRHSN